MSKAPELLVLDLDGTSLGGGYEPYARFPDHYSAFLDSLDAQGCRWALNTTWGAQGQLDLVKASATKSRPLFLMAELGARLWTVENEKLVPVESFNAETESLLAEGNEKGMRRFIKDCLRRVRPATMNFYGHWFDIVCVEEDAKKLQRFAEAADWNGYGLMKYGGGGTRLAVVHSFLGKNRSLAAALKLAGVRPERAVVAGDEAADIAMMGPELSAFPLCPANAAEKVKAAVLARNGAVGGKPCCDGVMEAFEALSKREGWGFQLKELGCIA